MCNDEKTKKQKKNAFAYTVFFINWKAYYNLHTIFIQLGARETWANTITVKTLTTLKEIKSILLSTHWFELYGYVKWKKKILVEFLWSTYLFSQICRHVYIYFAFQDFKDIIVSKIIFLSHRAAKIYCSKSKNIAIVLNIFLWSMMEHLHV